MSNKVLTWSGVDRRAATALLPVTAAFWLGDKRNASVFANLAAARQ